MGKFRVIDADGHCIERDTELAEYAEYRGRSLRDNAGIGAMPFFPSLDGWFRVVGDKLSAGDPEHWLSFLDETGIELTFLYPTSGLAHGLIQDREWAVALARAYNDWLYHRYMQVSPRFKGLALVPVQDVPAAVEELRRAVTELGMPGGVLPAATGLGKAYGHPDFHPLYAEAERLDCVLSIHGAPSKGWGFDYFDTFIKTHTLEHPVAQMVQLTSMLFDGVFEYFPRLRVAFLEAGVGWVPYMMDRMDEEFERRGARWCPYLKRKPSEYFRGGNLYFSCEVEERTLPYVVELLGEDNIFFPSDYPHERDRDEFLGDIPEFVERTDLSDRVKEKILFHNARRFYRLD
jgi:predicted TIM-barrel fold metal-dependent hydrolase